MCQKEAKVIDSEYDLAIAMIEYAKLSKELDRIAQGITSFVYTKRKSFDVMGIKASYHRGSRQFDHEAACRKANVDDREFDNAVSKYTKEIPAKKEVSWAKVSEELGLDKEDMSVVNEPIPSVKLKVD